MSFEVAIVGSGPAGFYAAEALLQSALPIRIDMFERLPVPFGLVRYGVAPDHQKLKAVTSVFESIAQTDRFTFFGNVKVGVDITIEDMLAAYDGVIVATGAITARPLGISGENMKGSVSASQFVGWYNGHPDFRALSIDLSHDTAIVVGNGNVALDVCRILSKSPDELMRSDICAHALDVLSASKISEIHLVGRRGPAQAKFAAKELREFSDLAACDSIFDPADLQIDFSVAPVGGSEVGAKAKNLEILKTFERAGTQLNKAKRLHFRFGLTPRKIQGVDRVESVVFARTGSDEAAFDAVETTEDLVTIPAGILIGSVGYRAAPLPGVPFDSSKGTIPHKGGRVVDSKGIVQTGLYVAGWVKRGPSGVIGTNRACGVETSLAVIADLKALGSLGHRGKTATRRDICASLAGRGLVVHFDGWKRIDALERSAGQALGKPREKFTTIHELLDASLVPAEATSHRSRDFEQFHGASMMKLE
ncbi:FAD-dependent oxidoreductase [Rhizobium rhizogenes]|uniref:FAD-dependent oxidoreductase n=1 Tax=Rhizobium rhizogenes TaxID=359 RepID=UPI001571F736|nr:FAD-dependent oxidoreductase [Rhizobium rhizogenes]NTH22963.1 FAD-dependent oxidoreductase [Rhizobium rhizogenes]NTH35993.1 FAD-dependent oxidoreductase [Rhizobium rhizogenes]